VLLILLPLVICIGNSALLIFHNLLESPFNLAFEPGVFLVITILLELIFIIGLSIIWTIMIYKHNTSMLGPDTYTSIGLENESVITTSGNGSGSSSTSVIQLYNNQVPEDFVVSYEAQKQRIQHLTRQVMILTDRLNKYESKEINSAE